MCRQWRSSRASRRLRRAVRLRLDLWPDRAQAFSWAARDATTSRSSQIIAEIWVHPRHRQANVRNVSLTPGVPLDRLGPTSSDLRQEPRVTHTVPLLVHSMILAAVFSRASP